MPFFNPNSTKEERVFITVGITLFLAAIVSGIGYAVYRAFPHPDSVDYNCVDFPNQDEAQRYFRSQGGSKTNNVDNLDKDGDGIACEAPSG